jgi:proline dehydrogenase
MLDLLNQIVAGVLPAVPKPILWRFSKRYIAGPRLSDALQCARKLNGFGCSATIDILGENAEAEEEARAYTRAYREVLEGIEEGGLDSNVSVKLTALGQRVGEALVRENLETLLVAARERGNFVRLDMEDSSTTSSTLQIYRDMRARGHDNVGVVLQSYMRRSRDDVEALAELRPGYRLCKGIYREPREIAWHDPEAIRGNFVSLLRRMLELGSYVGIATHDERLVWEAEELVRRMGLGRDDYEFQMLLGVDPQMRRILVERGHRLRVYVPFGESWRAYSLRRMRENPDMAGHVMRNLFSR